MEKKVKYSSTRTFKGSAPQDFFGEGYFLRAEGSNYGRKDVVTGDTLFTPYTEEYYLTRDRLLVKNILKSLRGINTAIVLGCARGYFVHALRERGVEAVGVDISEWAIENCMEDVTDYVYCGDVCDLSKWGDEEFDLVVALDVFEHIKVPDLYLALDEACRVGKIVLFDTPIDVDDTAPDHSEIGTDQSHVSVYSKTWWITQFLRRELEPIHISEFVYPEENFSSRWPDKHDHGVTMYLRKPLPLPTTKTVSMPTIKPDGKNFKILWWSNGPWTPTGYGAGTKGVVYPLLEHYDISCLASYGLEGAALGFNGLICYPRRFDQYGIDAANMICKYRKPDVMVTLFDIWIGDNALYNGKIDWFTKIHPRWIPQFPIDSDPIAPPVLNQARQAYRPVVMSQFGRRQLEMQGIPATYIPHGVNTNIFKPSMNKTADLKHILDTSEEMIKGKTEPWPEGCFVIGKVAANKDTQRKGFDRDFAAIEMFFDQNPDARSDTRVYLHTNSHFPSGGSYPLAGLADRFNIAEYIRLTNPFHMYCGMTEADLSRVYGGFDVLLNASKAEGFGIPIIEAAACGVPTIGTDFTSMTELIKGHGWLVNSLKNAGGNYSYDPTILMSDWAIPDEFEIAQAIEDAYNNPDKVRKYGDDSHDFAQNYDWEKVITPLWVELFEEVREDLRIKTLDERRLF